MARPLQRPIGQQTKNHTRAPRDRPEPGTTCTIHLRGSELGDALRFLSRLLSPLAWPSRRLRFRFRALRFRSRESPVVLKQAPTFVLLTVPVVAVVPDGGKDNGVVRRFGGCCGSCHFTFLYPNVYLSDCPFVGGAFVRGMTIDTYWCRSCSQWNLCKTRCATGAMASPAITKNTRPA